jgi:site-specific DNA recombinase
MAVNVRIIPATPKRHSAQNNNLTAKRRVAAYARVSTDSEEQLTSYEAQVDYYTKFIKDRSALLFALHREIPSRFQPVPEYAE